VSNAAQRAVALHHNGVVAALVLWMSRAIAALCVAGLVGLAVLDSRVERYTAGLTPQQFARRLDAETLRRSRAVTVVAHNAGDDLTEATRAVAYGADAIEIDVRAAGGELFASHNAPLPFLEDLVFRGPSLESAWDVARLRDTVLLHLKEGSPRFLAEVRAFLAAHPLRRVIVQSADPATLEALGRAAPRVQRLLLVLDSGELHDLRGDRRTLAAIDGVSVRESVLSAGAQAWLERRRLLTFAWTVDDEERMEQLVARGIDGVITDRLDIMQLLGRAGDRAR
jgi:glycerophosphoryl diester phosphodiesterase